MERASPMLPARLSPAVTGVGHAEGALGGVLGVSMEIAPYGDDGVSTW